MVFVLLCSKSDYLMFSKEFGLNPFPFKLMQNCILTKRLILENDYCQNLLHFILIVSTYLCQRPAALKFYASLHPWNPIAQVSTGVLLPRLVDQGQLLLLHSFVSRQFSCSVQNGQVWLWWMQGSCSVKDNCQLNWIISVIIYLGYFTRSLCELCTEVFLCFLVCKCKYNGS